MENSVFLLNDADKEFFASVTAAIEQALAEEGIEQRGEGMSITEGQARRITKRLPSAPSAIIEKWEELTRKPFFMLMETIERDASGNSLSNWFYMKSDSRDSFLEKMPLLYPVDASSEAYNVLSDLREFINSAAALYRIAEVLGLEEYSYIPLKAYSDIEFSVRVCREIDSVPKTLKSKIPEKFVIPNNKLANTIANDESLFENGLNLIVSGQRAKKQITTACVLTYENDNVKLTGKPFTEFDRNVYNAVTSLYVYGDPSHIVTPAMVYRAMTGLKDPERPSARQLADVMRSLDKMRFIRARINCTAELKKRRISIDSKQITNGEIDTYLLSADAIKVQAGGQTVKAYHIIRIPILYEYSSAVKQVLTIPASLLDIKELDSAGNIMERSLANTDSRILIRGYLIRRIEGMKGGNNLENYRISLFDYEKDGETHQGIYSIAGKPAADRKEMQRIREDTEKMLAFWKATGYISGFEPVKAGKKITGYKIIP